MRVFCPKVSLGQTVYLCHRPLGRNKIQDAWSPVVYKGVDIQGTTHTIEPLEGGPTRTVHRTELRPRTEIVSPPDVNMPTVVEMHTSDKFNEPDFVVLEEVTDPHSSDVPKHCNDITDNVLVPEPVPNNEPLPVTDNDRGVSLWKQG